MNVPTWMWLATIGAAVELATGAGARELALFHHSPTRTDTAVDRIAETWLGAAGALTVSIAIEGLERNIVSASEGGLDGDRGCRPADQSTRWH